MSLIAKPSDCVQNIEFSGDDDEFDSVAVYAQNVVIKTTAGDHNHGSSKVKLKNVVDYSWEPRIYGGQLIAVHMSGIYMAYAIKVPSSVKAGTWIGMVRVAQKSADKRALLKGMVGQVQDLAFAHTETEVVLASIDEEGTVFIHSIQQEQQEMKCALMLQVLNNSGGLGVEHRVVWCPYIPEKDDTDDYGTLLLVTTHGNKACMWSVSDLVCKYGAGPHVASQLSSGALTVAEHAQPVVDAAFSPDGTALATASIDGYVMFFQVYLHNENKPHRLHQWQPHDGLPLSCLFFLDNYKRTGNDALHMKKFWKYAVTGAEKNTVLKIWCCKTWACLQTISFASAPSHDSAYGLKAVLDASAKYLLLSDVKRRCLYVLEMSTDSDDTIVFCNSVSEFLLPCSVLSFNIIDAGIHALKCPSSCADPYHNNVALTEDNDATLDSDLNTDELEEDLLNGQGTHNAESCNMKMVLRMYLVQPKSLQEATIVYSPSPLPTLHTHFTRALGPDIVNLQTPSAEEFEEVDMVEPGEQTLLELNEQKEQEEEQDQPINTILDQQTQRLKNLLMRAQNPITVIGTQAESPSAPAAPTLNLMTPAAFSVLLHRSPSKREEEDPPISATPDVTKETATNKLATPPSAIPEDVTAVFSAEMAERQMASGGSSPSREVQEILSLKGSDCFYEDELDDTAALSPTTPTPTLATAHGHMQHEDMDGFVAPDTLADSMTINAILGKETIWPQINMAKINEANQRKASSEKSLNSSLNRSMSGDEKQTQTSRGADGTFIAHTDKLSLSDVDKHKLDYISAKMETLVELVSKQQKELSFVRNELAVLRQSPPLQPVIPAPAPVRPHVTPEQLQVALEQVVQRQHELTTQTIEEALSSRWESAGSAAARAAGAAAARILEPVARAMQNELATKMAATDHLLRENIQKMVNSKTIMESLASMVATSMHSLARDSFREAIQQSLLPAMEKAHAQIFKQINHSFQNGTKEFATNTEAAARAAAERGGAAAATQLRAALERHAAALETAVRDVARAPPQPPAAPSHPPPPTPHELKQAITQAVRSVLEHEMSKWRVEATAAVAEMASHSSRSHSPQTPGNAHATQSDRQAVQTQVSSLLRAGQLNAAFQTALTASDLELVVHACRTADPARVFAPPCALQQHVLLSLIQQLGADITQDTELKHRYLEEAIMNLEPNNPVTREYMPPVVRDLKKQLMAFTAARPTHAANRRIRMLLMATDSLLKP